MKNEEMKKIRRIIDLECDDGRYGWGQFIVI